MLKKTFSFLLAVLLCLNLFSCGNDDNRTAASKTSQPTEKTSSYDDQDIPVISILLNNPGGDAATVMKLEKSIPRIEDAINALCIPDIGVKVSLSILKGENPHLVLSDHVANGDYDMYMYFSDTLVYFGKEGYILDLTELIESYGEHLKESYEIPEILSAINDAGPIYAVPIHEEYASYPAAIVNASVLERNGLDASSLDSFEGLDSLFRELHPLEPGMYMTYIDQYIMVEPPITADILTYSLALTGKISESADISYLFETPEYREWNHWVYDWSRKGYVHPSSTDRISISQQFMMSEELFSFFVSAMTPSILKYYEDTLGLKLIAIPLGEAVCTTDTVRGWACAVSSSCKTPEAAVKLLDYFMYSKEMNMILNWGVEGTDYIINDDGLLDYPEDVGYYIWHYDRADYMPNQTLLTPWCTEEKDVYEKIADFNRTATLSKLLGFTFDPAPVQDLIDTYDSIYIDYLQNVLSDHIPDPAADLDSLVQKLYNNGLQTILDEANAQAEAFLAR